MAYTRPQLQVFQEFRAAPIGTTQNLNAFIFGPNYQLFRYDEAAEKALIGLGSYDKDSPQTYLYPNRPSGSIVDQGYIEVYVDNAWLKYATVPQDATNPFVAVSDTERNKLRAAPRVADGEEVDSTTPTVTSGGYFTGNVGLPEAYYWLPNGDFTIGAGVGTLDYVTTEGLTGQTDLPANATTAGVIVQGPNGITMDWDNSAAVVVPRILTIADSTGLNYFTITLKDSKRADAIDADIDLTQPYEVEHSDAALSASFVTNLMTIDFEAADTLGDIRSAVVAVSDILANYDVSAITGVDTGTTCTIEDQDAASITTATPIIPDAWRIKVFENTWVFQTENGYTRSAALLKDVVPGDRIRLTVTPAATGVPEEVLAKIVSLEADYTLPVLGDATADSGNQATQTGDDLSGGAALIAAGSDNQRDFDGPNTDLYSLGTDNYMLEDLARGLLTDSFTITITTGGAAGTAKASIANLSGTYSRTDVPIEAAGTDDGQIYIGYNMYMNLDQGGGDADAIFQVGDTYTAQSVDSPYTEITGQTVSGTYAGLQDTTYMVEVTRGGRFDRTSYIMDGIQSAGGTVLSADISNWSAGDVDDEYILECVSGGGLTTAEFQLTSQRGDDQSSVGFTAAATNQSVGANGLQLAFSVDVAFTAGDYWVVHVYGARPAVRITDSAGVDQGSVGEIINDGVAIALGLNGGYITFPANANDGLALGEVFSVEASASAPAAVQTIVVSDEVSDNVLPGLQADGDANEDPDLFQGDLFIFSNSKEIPEEQHDPTVAPGSFNWVSDDDDITINDGITVQDASWVDGTGTMPYLELWYGDLFSQYRALLSEYADTIYSIDDIGSVDETLGTIDPDNPLAQGVYKALENSGPTQVYYMAVPTDDSDGYSEVLERATLVDLVYAFAPLTRDAAILSMVDAHINALSQPDQKKWRVALFGATLPTESVVLAQSNNPLGTPWEATIIDDPRVPGNQYRKVVLTQDGDLLQNMSVGDEVRYLFSTDAWGNEVYETGEVGEVESDTVFYLVDSLAAPVPVASRIESYHPLSVAEQATAVAAESEQYMDRRIYNVFPALLNAFGVSLTSEYGACAIAGLCSSVVPQQGLTHIEVEGFDDLPMVYSTFSASQLDEMAGSGTLIIMQEVSGGTIFVRHQVSTAASTEDLNQTELSLVKNLDSISYFFVTQLRGYIGRYNVTPELLGAIRTQLDSGLNYLGSLTSVGLLGPQILLENSEIVSVQQHSTFRDRVIIRINLDLPAPLNVIELYLVV